MKAEVLGLQRGCLGGQSSASCTRATEYQISLDAATSGAVGSGGGRGRAGTLVRKGDEHAVQVLCHM
jgi:hypothetical protein